MLRTMDYSKEAMKRYRGSLAMVKSADGARYAEGHLVRYGALDDQDLEGENFSKRTNFMRESGFPIKGSPAMYEHGLTDFGAIGIGVFDFVDEDDIGLFVRAKLFEREDYERMLKEISKRKSLNLSPEVITQKAQLAVTAVKSVLENVKHQWSMGAYVPTVEVALNGHIDQCGIVEGSLTVMPAEPNGTEATIYQKSLFEAFDLTVAATESPVTGSAPEIDAMKSSRNNSGVKQMDMQMVRDAIASILSMLDQGAMEDGALDKQIDEKELEEETVKAAGELLEEDEEVKKALDEEDEKMAKATTDEDKEEVAKSAQKMVDTWLEKNMGSVFERALGSIEKKRSNVNSAFKSALPSKTTQSKRSQAGAYGTGGNPGKAPAQTGRAEKPGLASFIKSAAKHDFDKGFNKAQNPYIGDHGGYLLGQELRNDILPPLRADVVAFAAGVQQTNVPQGVGTITLPKMTTAPTAYRPGINTAITESDASFDTVTAFLRPIAAKVTIPFQLLEQSPLAVEQRIREEMIRSIALQIDIEILNGTGSVVSGTGAQIRGVKTVLEGDSSLSSSNIVTLATNGRKPTFDDANNAETQIAAGNIPDTEAKSWIMHSRSRGRFRGLTATTGEPLFRDNYGVEAFPELIGYPVHVGNQIGIADTTGSSTDTSEVYFGAWRYVEYVMQDALEIIVDRVTVADQLQARIIAYTYSDILIHYPEAFYVMKGVR